MTRAEQVIIFGLQDTAQLAHYYLTHDSPFGVAAFAVSADYYHSIDDAKTKLGIDLPVYPFENLDNILSPKDYKLFVPMTGAGMNKKREKIYLQGKHKGYEYVSYISSKATVLTDKIGENCFILEDNT